MDENINDILSLLFQKAAKEKDIKRREIKEPYITAEDGQFLGTLSINKKDPDSIFNEYGLYGSKFSDVCIFNPDGIYGSEDSPYSAYSELTSTPPRIIHKNRTRANLTKNDKMPDCIDPDELVEEAISKDKADWDRLLEKLVVE